MFRKMRGIGLSEEKQGLLFFTCRDYRNQRAEVQVRVRRLCDEVGGEEKAYRKALFELLTTRESVTALSLKHGVSTTKLYDLRRTFYEKWYTTQGVM